MFANKVFVYFWDSLAKWLFNQTAHTSFFFSFSSLNYGLTNQKINPWGVWYDAQIHISPDAAPSELWDFESKSPPVSGSWYNGCESRGFICGVRQTDSHKTVCLFCDGGGGGSDLVARARLFGIHGAWRSFSCCWGLCGTHWLGSIYIVHCDTKQEHREEENIIRESWVRLSLGIGRFLFF